MSKFAVIVSVAGGVLGIGTVGIKGAQGLDGRYMHAATAHATLDERYLRVDTAQQLINRQSLVLERDQLETKRDLLLLRMKMLVSKSRLTAEDQVDLDYCKSSLTTIEARLMEIRKVTGT